MLHIKETAVHRVSSRAHVMNIDIAVTTCLYLLGGKEERLIEFLVKLVEYERTLGGYKSGVSVGILLVSDIHDGLALLVYVIEHAHKILLVVAVIPVALCNNGLNLFKGRLNDIVHYGYRDLVSLELIYLVADILAYLTLLLLGKLGQRPVCALAYGIDNLLYIELLVTAILLDDYDMSLGHVPLAVIIVIQFLNRFHHNTHH